MFKYTSLYNEQETNKINQLIVRVRLEIILI
jgi:hypothetical protein